MGRDSLGKRPEDYYGPEDYYEGQDIAETLNDIKEAQADWDKAYKALPWWRKIFM